MGYKFRIKRVVEWMDHEHMRRIFRVEQEVYEPVPIEDHPILDLPLYTDNIIRTEIMEVRLNDDFSASSDPVTYTSVG